MNEPEWVKILRRIRQTERQKKPKKKKHQDKHKSVTIPPRIPFPEISEKEAKKAPF